MSFSIIIPYEPSDDPWRERAFEFVHAHYLSRHSDCELIVSGCPTVEWSKGAAINAGVARATREHLILADADSFMAQSSIIASQELLRTEAFPQWIVPHGMVFRLNAARTEIVYGGGAPRETEVVRHPYMGPPGGGINVMTRQAFDAVNGMDERFLGWGGEDICFGIALTTMKYFHYRLGDKLWHLYHPHPAPDLRGPPESEALVARYRAADRKPELMRELVFSR